MPRPHKPAMLCTGTLVAPSWILTADHCTFWNDQTLSNPLVPTDYRIYVGGQGPVYADEIVREPAGFTGSPACKPACIQNDLALLHLTSAQPGTSVLPLLPSPSVPDGTPVTLWGYGGTTKLEATRAGEWRLDSLCGTPSETICYQPIKNAKSKPAGGDSGGPWTVSHEGATVIQGLESGPGGKTTNYGPDVVDYLSWVRSTAGLPGTQANTIIKDSQTSAAWLLDSSSFRRPIASGSDYDCLVSEGIAVTTVDDNLIPSVPLDSVDPPVTATCSSTTYTYHVGYVPNSAASYPGAPAGDPSTIVSANVTDEPIGTPIQVTCWTEGADIYGTVGDPPPQDQWYRLANPDAGDWIYYYFIEESTDLSTGGISSDIPHC